MYTDKDIADYYKQTRVHYSRWWNLNESKALHYGIHYPETKTFAEALRNTNKLLADLAGITSTDNVLDAGCGVGGTSFFVAKEYGCKVTGITISPDQLRIARESLHNFEPKAHVQFDVQDYHHTNFPDASFDVVMACESSCHADPKEKFIKEVYRLLKPGGRFIFNDFFHTDGHKPDPNQYMKKWGDTWAVNVFNSTENFIKVLENTGFKIEKDLDYTREITPSAKRMYHSYLLGLVPSVLYNLFHNTSRFGKTHYLCGYYQYKALVHKLWYYRVVLAVKK